MFDHALIQIAQRRALAAQLRAVAIEDRTDAVRMACIETGGSLILPQQGNQFGTLEVELSLLGLSHFGDTVEAAIDNWIKAASRCTPLPHTGAKVGEVHP